MVADVVFDSEGTLWIAATGEGVFSYRFDTRKLTNYRHDAANPNSLSNNNVNNITQDSKGNLWFSTSGSGLDLYRPETNDFENFDKGKTAWPATVSMKRRNLPPAVNCCSSQTKVFHL